MKQPLIRTGLFLRKKIFKSLFPPKFEFFIYLVGLRQRRQLADEIDALGLNDDVRVIIVGAAGKGFCAGVDIKELAADGTKIVDVNKGNYETFRAIHRNPKPVIVALHNFVLGGGIGMAGAADIIVCSECARFGVPEIDRGAMGGGAHLQRMFPVQKVRYMYFTGEFIDAR